MHAVEEKKQKELDQGSEPINPSKTEFVKTIVTITWQKMAQQPVPPNLTNNAKGLKQISHEPPATRTQTSMKVDTRVVER